jgi:Asp-tRNA(Asn)/Glu-tRNA(Gln) amidotransferase A subunit family amidase
MGFQVMGRSFDEAGLLNFAKMIQAS